MARTAYDAYINDIARVRDILVEQVLTPIVEGQYENRHCPPEEVLPEEHDLFVFEEQGFTAEYHPVERRLCQPHFAGRELTTTSIARRPAEFADCPTILESLWTEIFGEWSRMRKQPDHPGPPPIESSTIKQTLLTLDTQREEMLADGGYKEFLAALVNKDHYTAAQLLGEDPEEILDQPPQDDEVVALLTSGVECEVIYDDGEMAVVVQDIEPAVRRRLFEDRTGFRMANDVPEEGFVVGRDDTPVGLFVHGIDVTELDLPDVSGRSELRTRLDTPDKQRGVYSGSAIERSDIQQAMGFDRELRDDEHLTPQTPEVRLQGDLAIEGIRDPETFTTQNQRETRNRVERVVYRGAIETAIAAMGFGTTFAEQFEIDVRPPTFTLDVETFTTTRDAIETLEDVLSDNIVTKANRSGMGADTRLAFYINHIESEINDRLGAQADTLHQDIERRVEQRLDEMDVTDTTDLWLPIDNHLVIVESALLPPFEERDEDPVHVYVTEPTTLQIRHDEHDNVIREIDPGEYRFYLLPRGPQPLVERPQWEY